MDVTSTVNLQSMRVDLVGSLLRPQSVKDAFARYGEGTAGEADLKQAQDDAIRDVVAKQVAHNLPIIVDGEFRRTSFMESFAVVAGVEEWQAGVKTYHELLKRGDDNETVTHKGQDPILLNRKHVTAAARAAAQLAAGRFSLCSKSDRSAGQSDIDRRRIGFNNAMTAWHRARCIRVQMSFCVTWWRSNGR